MNNIKLGVLAILAVVGLFCVSKMFSTVSKGTYQVKQAAITGTMSAKMEPGIWGQWFGDIQTWPKAETFYFTADKEEGAEKDQSVEVQFADGSRANISGTLRIQMPATETQALELITKHSFKSYTDLEQNLILKVVRNALTLTANMMTARESYSEKRNDYVFWAWDQIQNGSYEFEEVVRDALDISGEKISKSFKIVKKDKDGKPIYQKSSILGTGIIVSNFEIKKIVYAETVEKQIAEQQKAYMAVATAKAEVQKAEQEKLKIEAEGKAAVAKSQYEQEQEKVKETVQAQKRLEVARMDKETAALKKAKDILEGEGEAEKRRLIMNADGALSLKLDAWTDVNKAYADAISKQKWVPEIQMGSTTGSNNAQDMINMLMIKTAKDIGLELNKPQHVDKK